MYQHKQSRNRYDRWENKYIDAKCKNKHNKSRHKLSRTCSNSLKQELRSGGESLQLFDRIYTNRNNKHYSLEHFMQCDNIYDDYNIILNHSYSTNHNNDAIDIWHCSRCTYINIECLPSCKMCQFPYDTNANRDSVCTSDHDTNSVLSSSECSSYSEPIATTQSTLSSYIIHHNKHNRKRIKRKRSPKKAPSFKLDDESYKQFKKYMRKRKTSIIAHKTAKNDYKWNTVKQEKRKNEAQKLYAMYRTLYLSQNKSKEEITSIIHKMAHFIPKKHLKTVLPQIASNTTCKVCYADTATDAGLQLISMSSYCSHCMICKACFVQYLQITIRDDEHIMPWLLCPAQGCKAPIHPTLLLEHAAIEHLYTFGRSFVYKHLQRSSFWLNCADGLDKKCRFGWILMDDDYKKNDVNKAQMELNCDACGYCHMLQLQEAEQQSKEDGFAALIARGIMRECPKCSYPAMKDYGMCNVMHCGKCSVYWNWRTRHYGTSTHEVKNKARNEGSLWENGELSYQQNLQRNDLNEFKALLARNGIKYDPNYRRGS